MATLWKNDNISFKIQRMSIVLHNYGLEHKTDMACNGVCVKLDNIDLNVEKCVWNIYQTENIGYAPDSMRA